MARLLFISAEIILITLFISGLIHIWRVKTTTSSKQSKKK